MHKAAWMQTTLTELLASWHSVRLDIGVKIDIRKQWEKKKKYQNKVVGMTTAVAVSLLCEWKHQCQLCDRKISCKRCYLEDINVDSFRCEAIQKFGAKLTGEYSSSLIFFPIF